MKIINLHTHFALPEGRTGLISHPVQGKFSPVPGQFYSVGLHPWHLEDKFNDEWLALVDQLAVHPQVLAIGECGLDRSTGTDMDKQKSVFVRQIEIAEKHDMPLIIHSVRAWSDILYLKKKRHSAIPWILHGYAGNAEITRQLTNHGFYFSFGALLLKNHKKLNQSLRAVPHGHLFFETDESHEYIESIYGFASAQLNIPVDKLQELTFRNFKNVFGI